MASKHKMITMILLLLTLTKEGVTYSVTGSMTRGDESISPTGAMMNETKPDDDTPDPNRWVDELMTDVQIEILHTLYDRLYLYPFSTKWRDNLAVLSSNGEIKYRDGVLSGFDTIRRTNEATLTKNAKLGMLLKFQIGIDQGNLTEKFVAKYGKLPKMYGNVIGSFSNYRYHLSIRIDPKGYAQVTRFQDAREEGKLVYKFVGLGSLEKFIIHIDEPYGARTNGELDTYLNDELKDLIIDTIDGTPYVYPYKKKSV